MAEKTKTFTNKELIDNFPEQIESRIPFIIHLEQLSPTLYLGYVAQNITSEVDMAFTDCTYRIERCNQFFSEEKITKLKLEVGSLLPKTYIKVIHRHSPKWPTQEPKKFMSGPFEGELMLYNGFPYYSHNELAMGDPVHEEYIPDQIRNKNEVPRTSTTEEDTTERLETVVRVPNDTLDNIPEEVMNNIKIDLDKRF